MKKILLLQLPVPQLSIQKQTGNIPLAGAYLKQSLRHIKDLEVEIIPESISSYYGDQALMDFIRERKPDMIGYTVYCWNIHRTVYLNNMLKKEMDFISVAGGPEINEDNPLYNQNYFDYQISGEGEIPFCALLSLLYRLDIPCPDPSNLISPYLFGDLEPEIERTMFLETQRGCPYHCSFCYYNKSRKGILQFSLENVIASIQYAHEHPDIDQVYLMDPSLNSRNDLPALLNAVKRINYNQKLSFTSEIRAETINKSNIDWYAQAGFIEFEVGLQSTNPTALKQMNRYHDLERFTEGCKLLLKNNIIPKIDMIIGLPGDTLDGFKKTGEYILEYQLDESLQIFALSLLPGTVFRKDVSNYGIEYQKNPPYTILSHNGFSHNQIKEAFFWSELHFGIKQFPKPYADLSYKDDYDKCDTNIFSKIVLYQELSDFQIDFLAHRLTSPYQIFIMSDKISYPFLYHLVSVFTKKNPFSPLELNFFYPADYQSITQIADHVGLSENLYLQNDLLYDGTDFKFKSLWINLIGKNNLKLKMSCPTRSYYHWDSECLPEVRDLQKYQDFDGILIDNHLTLNKIYKWQDRFLADLDQDENQKNLRDLPELPENFISFASQEAQQRWKKLCFSEEYALSIRPGIFRNEV